MQVSMFTILSSALLLAVIDLSFVRAVVDVIMDKIPFPFDYDDNETINNITYNPDGSQVRANSAASIKFIRRVKIKRDFFLPWQGPELRADFDVGDDSNGAGAADAPPGKKEVLKSEITTYVGAVLNKQECWEKSACIIGRRTSGFAAKDVVFLLAEKFVPDWKYTLDLVKAGSQNVISCREFQCSTKRKQ